MGVSATLTAEQREAVSKLWIAGVLQWKLDSAQKLIYKDIQAARARGKSRFVLLCSRRWGKTHMDAVLALEECLQKPGVQVAFISKTKRSARDIAEKVMRKILVDCPLRVKPTYHKADFRWDFRNGSALFFMGCDGEHYERARGREFNLIVIDEAGFIDIIDEIISDVLAPTLLTTNGFMLISSTRARKASHPFEDIFRRAQANDAFCFKTIYENPRLSATQVERAMEEAGGPTAATWRREYLNEIIDEESRAVVPEWSHAKVTGTPEEPGYVRGVPRPDYCDRYVSLDLGFRDLTVALFGWYQFAHDRVIIEDELVLQGATTGAIAGDLAVKMQALWGPPENREECGKVFQFSDVDPRLIYEFRTLHGLRFQQSAKDNKQAQINQLRLMVAAGQIVVAPRCKILIQTLFEASWDKNHKDYVRDAEIGHADALDALLYLIRNLRRNRNPVPEGHHWTEDHGVLRPKPASAALQALGSAFNKEPYGGLVAQVGRKLGRRRF